MQHVVIIGPAYPLRGGLATFNQRLARQFQEEGFSCTIYSFSLQYPSFIFPGTTQYSSEPPPAGINIQTKINSINPANWLIVGKELRILQPDILIVRFWLPFMGPALGTILRIVNKNKHTKIIAITDNIIPHEKRVGDTMLTRYFLKSCHAFITMSEKVMRDLKSFFPNAPAKQVLHPLYDNFGEKVSKEESRLKLKLPVSERIVLFFGFIRKYKGLDMLLQAMADERIRKLHIHLVIAGEFYEDQQFYQRLADSLGIQKQLTWSNHFIADSDVRYYLCAADVVIQPYRQATQSGVTPLAYHFEKPMIVSNVGSLPVLVPHEKVGLVCEPDPLSIAGAMIRFYELGEDHFIPNIILEKGKYSWSTLLEAITSLAGEKKPDKR